MLSVQNLEVVYQDVILVLRGVSFEIPKGEIVSLLGSNGSGKTTVIRSITGLLDVQNGDITKGSISVDGEDITNAKPSKIVEKGIAQVLEGRRIFAELTVVENLRLGGHTNSKDIPENIERVLDLFPILKERSKGEAGYLSGGEQQRVAIARAMAPNPKILLMDEPFGTLDQSLTNQLRVETRKILKDNKTTSIIVSHDFDDALSMSDKVIVIEDGTIIQSGSAKDITHISREKSVKFSSIKANT